MMDVSLEAIAEYILSIMNEARGVYLGAIGPSLEAQDRDSQLLRNQPSNGYLRRIVLKR